MPEMDGLSFAKQAKILRSDIVCFILSGYPETDEIRTAINEGIIYEHIMKPYEKEEFDQHLQVAYNNIQKKLM